MLEGKIMDKLDKVNFLDIIFTTIKDVINIDRKTDSQPDQ